MLDHESLREAERSCSRCRERDECMDLAWKLRQFYGVPVRWTAIRDNGIRVALEMAKGQCVSAGGGDMEVLW
jgi:hypothetical protein